MKSSLLHEGQRWRPVLWLGFASLLTAIAGEAARGVSGPFLGQLGASAAVVGIVAGAGELLGYTLRLGAGFIADRPGGAWRLLLLGTVVGISAVPLLSVSRSWQVAGALILAERIGRALRTPARDVLLSSASEDVGHGPGFGLHRLLDQAGAVAGPLAVAALFAAGHEYRTAFAVLFFPSAAAVPLLLWMRRGTVTTHAVSAPGSRAKLPRSFWILCACGGLLAAGTADFALISYHFARTRTAGPTAIPMLYAAAMAVEGVAALLLGFLLQRTGARALLLTIALSSAAAPMLFLGVVPPLWAVVAWSIGMGGQYALLRALVPAHVKPGARGAAFGWFNTVFGVFWFAGSATLGLMYGRSIGAMVFIAVVLQLAAIPLVLLLSVTSLDSSRTPRAARRVTTAERR